MWGRSTLFIVIAHVSSYGRARLGGATTTEADPHGGDGRLGAVAGFLPGRPRSRDDTRCGARSGRAGPEARQPFAILGPMSGHSKWSTIKRQKGVTDAKRGALFTKVAREISVAARQGGGDPDANYRLRLAIEKARSVNMPSDNIKRTIDKATGGGEADQFEEIVYEGYGPGGVAILVEAATDNRNRTAGEVRSIFTKAGGQLAGSGAVAWQFEPRGLIAVNRDGKVDADEVALAAIDAGAEDVDTEAEESIEIYTAPADLESVRKALEGAGVAVDSAENAMIAKQTVELDSNKARQALRLVELLEDLDDVQRVTANFDIPEDVYAEVAG